VFCVDDDDWADFSRPSPRKSNTDGVVFDDRGESLFPERRTLNFGDGGRLRFAECADDGIVDGGRLRFVECVDDSWHNCGYSSYE